jgi:hypothetical protein
MGVAFGVRYCRGNGLDRNLSFLGGQSRGRKEADFAQTAIISRLCKCSGETFPLRQ